LSPTSSSQRLLTSPKIQALLHQSGLVGSAEKAIIALQNDEKPRSGERTYLESEAEWILVSKATIQVYGLLLNTLMDQIIPLDDDLWYWDEVMSSHVNLSLYTVQTSPLRLWLWACDIKEASGARLRQLRDSPGDVLESGRAGLSSRWRQFYGIVRQSIAERSISDIQQRVLSPLARSRADALSHRKRLKRLRQMIASGMGILIDEGLRFSLSDNADSDVTDATAAAETDRKWKGVIERSVSLMDQVTNNVLQFENSVPQFEDKVFASVESDDLLSTKYESVQPALIAMRLVQLLETGIPEHAANLSLVVKEHGRPSGLVRYWLPVGALLLSSSTILRIIVNRREEIVDWITDFGTTVRDFWFNWVVEPTDKVIKTIRHDSNSEIAIMSRDSLKADRESLERMVVEFAADRPQQALGEPTVTEPRLAEIRAKVREGDVTPVLRAYENDLRQPFMGAVRGDLVRSLLIQVQKTKVDLEVAISGIDSLLKSQELVFGFIGLTPGVLVSIGIFQYLRSALGGRKGARQGHRTRRAIRALRNIDRIFNEAATDPATVNGMVSYKHRGFLVCEAHILRSLIHGLMPRDVEKDFLEDLEDVMSGQLLVRQVDALNRIRWTYSKWLQ